MAAFWWGTLAASSLIVGGLLAQWLTIPRRLLGLVMGFGVGVLTSAVAYELVEDSFEHSAVGVGLGLLCGAVTFYAGDTLIDRMGGHNRKRTTGHPANSAAPAIVLGIVLDGVPESIVLGLTVVTNGTVGLAVLAAVFLSNLPEAVAATVGLRARRWKAAPVLGLWVAVTLASGLAALLGSVLLESAPGGVVAFVNAFAGGAILTMLADTMAPEAFDNGGRAVGLVTTLGFLAAFLLTALA
ncbi:MAG: ZIP family zinc transporter [Streptosporangiales bacterium]|nr:ZIP family zinc transporter [Streptosporangiales bacterium]